MSTNGANNGHPLKGKEQAIASLLSEGKKPVDVIRQGYSRGTVYKVAKQVQVESTPLSDVDHAVEADPEIVDLKKQLRKAQLKHQIANLSMPSNLEARLKAIEERLGILWEKTREGDVVVGLEDAMTKVQEVLKNTPLKGLCSKFQCKGCSSQGLLAIPVRCTACGKMTRWGWWPKKHTQA